MLYDPNWKPAIVPAEVPKLEPWREILIKCAAVIEARGWEKGQYQDIAGRVCAIGAFRVVQGSDPRKGRGRARKYTVAEIRLAKRKLLAVLQLPGTGDESSRIINWNDQRTTSKRSVLAALIKAAAQ